MTDQPAAPPGPFRAARDALASRVGPVAAAWWANPLLHHRRILKPLPLGLLRHALPWVAGGLAALSIAAWAAGSLPAGRALGAGLAALSIGAVLIPLVAAAPAASGEAIRHDPALAADLPPGTVVWGLALAGLWRVRWLIVLALALAPAFIVGLLHLEASSFLAWRDSAQALGGATPTSRAATLLTEGRLPVFRLALRVLSAGLLPWVLLPLLAALGVAISLRLPDPALSGLASLLGGVGVMLVAGLAWAFLSGTPLLAGPREVARLLLIVGLLAAPGMLARWLNGRNAWLATG